MPKLLRLQIAALLICLLNQPFLLQAEEKLLAHKAVNFSVELVQDEQDVRFELKYALKDKQAAPVAAQAFAVENPWRIVLDISDLQIRKNLTLQAKANRLVSAVRLGAHSDKLRVVLDLAQDVAPEFTQTESNNVLRIVLHSPQEISGPTPTDTAPAATFTAAQLIPTASPTEIAPSATPIPVQPTASPAPTKTAAAEATPTIIKTKAPPPPSIASSKLNTNASLSIQAVEFEYLGAQKIPVVKITLTKQSQFKLEKQDERLFALTIPESSLSADYLALPQFPPHDFAGFTHVAGKPAACGVIFQIGVERGVRVTAFSRDNQILVKALNK